jgi:ribokinase
MSKTASTRDAVTFACWPPGPDERLARSSISLSGIATSRVTRNGSSIATDRPYPLARVRLRPVKVAVVGHVEWIEFARVPEVPRPGAIVHASELWEEPGGGGAVSAVQLAKLADETVLFTALGDDDLGHRVYDSLLALDLRLEVVWRSPAQRRGFVHVDAHGERTITVIGDRMGPYGSDALPWDELAESDAVYFTAGDAEAARRARAARVMTATARTLPSLAQSGVRLDALVASARDAGEHYEPGDLDPEPDLVARTAGAAGGVWERADGTRGEWVAMPPSGPVEDAYGCGDSFAGGFTWALGRGMEPAEAVLVGARCGAACLAGRGPYAGQLTAAAL